jgi:hypothetical protein
MASQSKIALVRPLPKLDDLFGCIVLKRRVASTRKEKKAARETIAREVAKE